MVLLADGGRVYSFIGPSTRTQSQREAIRELLHDFICARVKTWHQEKKNKNQPLTRGLEELHKHDLIPFNENFPHYNENIILTLSYHKQMALLKNAI